MNILTNQKWSSGNEILGKRKPDESKDKYYEHLQIVCTHISSISSNYTVVLRNNKIVPTSL
jgi:hypothetical protein